MVFESLIRKELCGLNDGPATPINAVFLIDVNVGGVCDVLGIDAGFFVEVDVDRSRFGESVDEGIECREIVVGEDEVGVIRPGLIGSHDSSYLGELVRLLLGGWVGMTN